MSTLMLKSYATSLWELGTPKNISYFWGFGRFLAIIIAVQIASGLLLAFYYVSGELAWNSVVELTREVNYGWLLRLVHRNGASFVFVILFLHFFRGMLQRSFYLTGPWLRGWLIKVLLIIAAFLGYVLPWGQISFWGATVIINLLRVLPIGKSIVIWLWGGFYVSSFTCRFFYALHFLVPFVVIVVLLSHILLLHFSGRSLPGGVRSSNVIKIKFRQLFLLKDAVDVRLLWVMWLYALFSPDWSADPVNFVPSDLSSSPVHIQPEWYFLHLYAVLRSIPNKLGGLIGFALALFILAFLPLAHSRQKLNHFNRHDLLIWRFITTNLLLMWLGRQPVESPYISIGQTLTVFYFGLLFILLLKDLALFQVFK
jgi:quinol-cytochrome oxidoreductase complex cytochrome b subunit